VGGDVINMGKIRRSTREARLAPLSGPALLIGSSIATEIGGAVQYPPATPTPLPPAAGSSNASCYFAPPFFRRGALGDGSPATVCGLVCHAETSRRRPCARSCAAPLP